MSYMGGIFTGNNSTLSADEANAGNIMGFGTSAGEGAVQSGLGFEEGLLSGNQAEEAKLLAPEIGTIQKQGQEQIQTAGEFGNRSGGVNASAQNNMDTQRSQVNDMVAKLTGAAANNVTSTGGNLLNTGLSAEEAQAKEAEQIQKNQGHSFIGETIHGTP